MAETIVEATLEGEEEAAYYSKIKVDVAQWLEKVASLGINKKDVLDYAFRKVMAMDFDAFILDMMRPRAEAVSLVEKVVEKKRVEEEVKAE